MNTLVIGIALTLAVIAGILLIPKRKSLGAPKVSRFSRKKIYAAFALILVASSAFAFVAGTNMAYTVGLTDGYKQGTTDTLVKVADMLQQKGVTLDWKQNPDYSYDISIKTLDGATTTLKLVMNLVLVHSRNGKVLSTERGAGTFTNLGKNWTVNQILYSSASIAGFVSGGGTSGIPVPGSTTINSSTAALYLGDSTTANSAATSTVQPAETQLDGMGRAKESAAYYPAGTGGGTIGQFNVTVTKTCTTAGITVAEWGLYYCPYTAVSTDQNSLIAYDSTPGSKNLAVGDTLQETWTGTFS